MAITTRDQLVNSLGNQSQRLLWDKATIASLAAGNYCSMWRATGQPGQGAIPAAATACTHATAGAFGVDQRTAPTKNYLGYLESGNSIASGTVEIHDRLAHMGGLNGTLTAAQTVGLDLSTMLASNNMAERIGDASYSDVNWWLEWYTATGSTAVSATVAVTYNDGTTGNLTVSLAATRPASQMIPLNTLIPAGVVGKFIRAVTSVTLTATTGTAGSFGVTATRLRASVGQQGAYQKIVANVWDLGMPEIYSSSCLFLVVNTATTSSGALRGQAKVIYG